MTTSEVYVGKFVVVLQHLDLVLDIDSLDVDVNNIDIIGEYLSTFYFPLIDYWRINGDQ